MPQLTVFTPTYNRAYILPRCYESMKRQTCKDFVWMIIDDGSTDETRELVNGWLAEDHGFEIRYLYQENQGMHGAHNLAYANIDTEINTCIDSDDYMTDDAVESILDFWNSCEKDEDVSGFMALDAYENGDVIGTLLPESIGKTTSYELYNKLGVKGDKKFILRSDLTRKDPYPIFEGERFVDLATKYSQLDEKYKIYCCNKVVCVVEYMEDGSSRNIFKQYVRNPKGFAYTRRLWMGMKHMSVPFRFKQAIHYVSSCMMAKDKDWLKNSPAKVMTVLAVPFGAVLKKYILHKAK